MKVFRAKFIAPIASPIIEDGFVAIDAGRIVDVGRFDAAAFTSRDIEDLGEVVLLPGLVNAHTHLELSHATQTDKPTSFGEWAFGIVRGQARIIPYDEIVGATLDGAAESLGFGITTVGDISRAPACTRPALKRSPLRVVSFGEVRAMARRRENLRPLLAAAVDSTSASDRLTPGISPHAPYSVEPDAYRACIRAAIDHRLPICTHLAESLDEIEFLAHHAGPLRDVWNFLGNWSFDVPKWTRSPVALAREVGLLDVAPLLAHVNYASDDDLAMLAASDSTVVWCPRTHAYFGHPPHGWREMLARGINVCVGTDSRASSPDLNVVDDLRLVYRQSPEVAVETLWEMVTTRAARGLHRSDVGAIERGMRADLVAFEVRGDEPLREILQASVVPRNVIIGSRLQSPSS